MDDERFTPVWSTVDCTMGLDLLVGNAGRSVEYLCV